MTRSRVDIDGMKNHQRGRSNSPSQEEDHESLKLLGEEPPGPRMPNVNRRLAAVLPTAVKSSAMKFACWAPKGA